MDEKIQVWAWIKFKGQFSYKLVWGGKSIIKAIFQAWVAKAYSGCVKIEWRGVR